MRTVYTGIILSFLMVVSGSAATYTVTNTNDSGPGSLRQAIANANSAGNSTVVFSIGSGVQTIMPLSVLPSVSASVIVDGTTQPGYAGTPLIELNDSLIATGNAFTSCIDVYGTVRGLAINRCTGRAIGLFSGHLGACFIGTDVTGHTTLPNTIGVQSLGQPGEIGGSDAEGNLISGNQLNVIIDVRGSVISYNRIGTDVTGEAALGFNGSAAISVQYTSDVSIHDNVIAAHSVAIECFYSDSTIISSNFIGISKSGNPLPNGLGIHVYQSNFTQIGTGGRNIIAYNNVAGIEMDGASIRNPIRGNSIHHNGGLGIDLSTNYTIDGVSANDAGDADTGPNLLQNYPVLTNVTSVGGTTSITGTINSTPNQLIALDFYSSSACSSSGYGEGETYLIGGSVQTDGNGNGSFVISLPANLGSGTVVTATATDPYGDTSEFSACAPVQGAGTFTFSGATFFVGEDAGSAIITVNRTNGTSGPASVSYATANGTATAGNDFTATAGTLAFADGQTSKTFTVPITNDAIFEGSESFTVALSGPTNGVTLGNPQTATVTISDDDAAPILSIADAQVSEGNSGTKNLAFTVTLTGATTVPATVQYQTQSNSASSGSDYQFVSGTLTFNPGETTKTIDVPIVGDTLSESDETFFVSLFALTNATFNRSFAIGTIVNDDFGPNVSVSDVRVVEGNSGTTNAVITLTASQPFYGEVDYFTVDGTAKSGSDYLSRSGIAFFSFETTKTITIPIVGDTQTEFEEVFTVNLTLYNYSSPSFVLTRPSVIVTIANDDAGIGPRQLKVPRGGTGHVAVTLGSATPQTITLVSSDPSVATVPPSVQITSTGEIEITGKQAGPATITATLPPAFGSTATTIDIYVYEPATLVLSPTTVNVPLGATRTVSATFTPALTVADGAALTTIGPGGISLPDVISIAPGKTTTFTIKGVTRGHVTLKATLGANHGSSTTVIDVEVGDPPTTPTITQVLPANGPAAGGTAVTLNGLNLRNECTIRFGGVPAASSAFVSATSMTATTPEHSAGVVDVALTCGADLFNFTNGFTYLAASATLSNVTPSFGNTAGNTLVKITGSNFASGCWPFFDGIPARVATVNSPVEMIASTPGHAAAGTVPLALRCSGTADASLANAFTYSTAAESSPVITGVDPLVGSSGKPVTITGARFRFDDSVTFDNTPATVLSTAPGVHIVRIPDLPLGKSSITLTDLGGHISTTGPIFTIVEPQPPSITSVSPASARPANEVTLDGSGFRPGYSFVIGDQPATLVSLDYTRVVLRVPQLAPGAYGVNVLNPASKIAAVGPQLQILPAGLAVTRVSPVCATTDGGESMTISGTGFVTGAVVTFNGVIASGATVVDAQTINVTVPPLPAGAIRIVVTNANGDSASLSGAFNVTSPFDPNGCSARSRPARH